MKKLLVILLIITSCKPSKKFENFNFTTTFEASDGKKTATYVETITYYKALAETFSEISIDSLGSTDAGEPLHYVTYQNNTSNNKTPLVLFINNGIHPGESDGIDATMMLFRDLVTGKTMAPEQVKIVTIPIYNVVSILSSKT